MRRFPFVLAELTLALAVAGCSGGGSPTQTTALPADGRLVDSGIAHPRNLRLMRTPPLPPPIRHRITPAMRARASAAGWTTCHRFRRFQTGRKPRN